MNALALEGSAVWFDALGRHLAVFSQPEAVALIGTDRNFWNVVSIHGPHVPRAVLRGAKRVHHVAFDDAEQIEGCVATF